MTVSTDSPAGRGHQLSLLAGIGAFLEFLLCDLGLGPWQTCRVSHLNTLGVSSSGAPGKSTRGSRQLTL